MHNICNVTKMIFTYKENQILLNYIRFLKKKKFAYNIFSFFNILNDKIYDVWFKNIYFILA